MTYDEIGSAENPRIYASFAFPPAPMRDFRQTHLLISTNTHHRGKLDRDFERDIHVMILARHPAAKVSPLYLSSLPVSLACYFSRTRVKSHSERTSQCESDPSGVLILAAHPLLAPRTCAYAMATAIPRAARTLRGALAGTRSHTHSQG